MYYYKLNRDNEKGRKLDAMLEACKRFKKMALDLIKEVGASGGYQSNISKGGGIYSFTFDSTPDRDLWRRKADGWYPINQPELIKKVEALPYVSAVEWSNFFNTDVFHQPGVFLTDNVYWISSDLPLEFEFLEPVDAPTWASAKESFTLNLK